jgi:hypothetical protein
MRYPRFYLIYIVLVANRQGQRQGTPSTFLVLHPELHLRVLLLPAYADEDGQTQQLR